MHEASRFPRRARVADQRVHVVTIRRGDDAEAERQKAELIACGKASPRDLFVIINKFAEWNGDEPESSTTS